MHLILLNLIFEIKFKNKIILINSRTILQTDIKNYAYFNYNQQKIFKTFNNPYFKKVILNFNFKS